MRRRAVGDMPMPDAASMAQVKNWIQSSGNIVVLTGAGISTDSGVPDFRGPSGVWTKDPSMQRLVDLDAWMTEEATRKKGWQWLSTWRLDELQPNRGHKAIVDLHHQGKLHLCVTQNTEGLQEMAGLPLEKLVMIHGSRRLVFEDPQTDSIEDGGCDFWCYASSLLQRVQAGDADPKCPECGSILKTANISFGQQLVAADIQRAMQAAQDCDLLLAIGTTLSVFPVAEMVPAARRANPNAKVVIINGEPLLTRCCEATSLRSCPFWYKLAQ